MVAEESDEGAIFNDFDFDPSQLLENDEIDFSTSSNLQDLAPSCSSSVPQDVVDYAVLEADRQDGVLYDYLSFTSPLFDCTSRTATEEYMEKVYDIIVSGVYKDIEEEITPETTAIFEMRQRSNWEGPDSVYDACLLSTRTTRKWFPYKHFVRLFPDWEETYHFGKK